jgi:lysyl-tRNA synthetase class 1
MYWADSIAKEIKKRKLPFEWVDDMKTPSGHIHVGALRGVIIHDLIYRALKDAGIKTTYSYVINDHDPIDALPVYLPEKKFHPHMGKPLFMIPSPVKGFSNFARYFAQEFIEVFNTLGAKPLIIWSSELYKSGKMDAVIKEALDQAPKILKIYQKIAGYPKKRKGWLPFQVVCPKCDRVGTTEAFDWNGETVAFECLPNLVSWAKGCGYKGRISPFGGNGKLLWKVDWPAHWKVIGVTIEAAGKDHFSAGGSRDMAVAFCQQIFKIEPPLGFGYEFFLIGGKKMSSSKGLGSIATEVAKVIPPELLRFLMTRTHYKKAIDFDPRGYTIADLFDEYDRCAKEFWQYGRKSDLSRIFELSQIRQRFKKQIFLPRFRSVATFIQMPSINVKTQFEQEKGGRLNLEEEKVLNQRIKYAKIWLDGYAPEDFIFKVQPKLPKEAQKLSLKQREYLAEVAILMKKSWKDEKQLENGLYEAARKLNFPSTEAFKAIYLIFLGKPHGPKAVPFLLAQEKKFLVRRFEEATTSV